MLNFKNFKTLITNFKTKEKKQGDSLLEFLYVITDHNIPFSELTLISHYIAVNTNYSNYMTQV